MSAPALAFLNLSLVEIFLDTADPLALKRAQQSGGVNGVTTNPSLIAKQLDPSLSPAQQAVCFHKLCQDILALKLGPTSLEVTSKDTEGMVRQGRLMARWGQETGGHPVIKVPMTPQGLQACRQLRQEDIDVNVTLCFSLSQALLAAKAGATYVSPFLGRLDDSGVKGVEVLYAIRRAYDLYGAETRILAASVRHQDHIEQSILGGTDAITIPPALFQEMLCHPLTDAGLSRFEQDWQATGLAESWSM